jgi:2-C-methyl-D-erythritol 4-phosphate cytidylyltransferase
VQVTDDTAGCELIGQAVELVEGRWPNPKVTTPSDLPYVELLLKSGGVHPGEA